MDTISVLTTEVAGLDCEVRRLAAHCATVRHTQRDLNQHAAFTDARLDAIDAALGELDTRLGLITEAINHLLDRLPASA